MRRIQFHLIKAFIECLLHKRHAAAGVGGPVGKSSDTGQNEIRTIRKRRHKHRAGAKEEGVVRSECFSWIPGKKEPGTKSSPVTLIGEARVGQKWGARPAGGDAGERTASRLPPRGEPGGCSATWAVPGRTQGALARPPQSILRAGSRRSPLPALRACSRSTLSLTTWGCGIQLSRRCWGGQRLSEHGLSSAQAWSLGTRGTSRSAAVAVVAWAL